MREHDFSEFYEGVHGHQPFPWQSDLVADILSSGTWPSLVDVPTGLGKTSLLDIAAFVTAATAGSMAGSVLGRRRMFLVVDRRLVVDQAFIHAQRIATALQEAEQSPGVLGDVARALRSLSATAEGPVLPVVRMRGGTTWESAWLTRPDTPAIITGTIDQVGSRLLFRGYGTSQRRRPIDAALVGTDSLILVDEAHLADALVTSLEAIQRFDSSPTMTGLPRPAVVQLTATASTRQDGWVSRFDEGAHAKHQIAGPRLQASKQLRIMTTDKAKLAKETATQTVELARDGTRVLAVCNTVDHAREVHGLIRASLPASTPVFLLTGRSRPLDRGSVVDAVLPLFGADREEGETAAVLVATQTIEVGIDLDAHHMVTQLASWDALVQRFGRVNRRGRWSTSDIVVIDDGDPNPPVYGSAAIETGRFLTSLATWGAAVEVSPSALRKLGPPPGVFAPAPLAPLLLAPQLDAWVRTAPAPLNDPPLDPYLHGIDRGVAPVTVAWRAGLGEFTDGESLLLEAEESATAILDTLPVRPEESIEIPIGAVRRWLSGARTTPVSDLEGDDDWDIPFGATETAVLRRELDVDGSTRWRWATARDVRPGDTIVVPAELGGVDVFGWHPASTTPVVDIAELAALRRGAAVLRLDGSVGQRFGSDEPQGLSDALRRLRSATEPDLLRESLLDLRNLLRGWLRTLSPRGAWTAADLESLGDALESMMPASVDLAEVTSDRHGVILVARPKRPWESANEESPDGTVHLSGADKVSLASHLQAVRSRAVSIGKALGLPATLLDTVADAAAWHDLGKVDPRFQAMLWDGDRMSADLAAEPLAKSGMPAADLTRRRRALRASGLPHRARHEAWSEAVVERYLADQDSPYEGDKELLLHLIASHHGHARPLLPPVHDSAEHDLEAIIHGKNVQAPLPREVPLSSADRFSRLNQRYGRWGLASLESVVRCADMTISAEGS